MSNVDPDYDDGPSAAEIQAQADAQAATARAEAAERQLALVSAGVDITTPTGRMFLDAYKGELNPEAIKASATEVGAIRAPEPVVEEKPDNTEADERLNLGAGAAAAYVPDDAHPAQAGMAEFDAALARGETRERAASYVVQSLLTAAVNGDQRAMYDPARWKAEAGDVQ